jgi:hypothetical protein
MQKPPPFTLPAVVQNYRGGGCTTWVSVAELGANEGSPEYAAWTGSDLVSGMLGVQLATPVLVLTGTAVQLAASPVLPLNVTVPPSGTGVTLAVKVTGCPLTDGFAEDDSEVEVEFCTCSVRVAELLGAYDVSPEYATPIVCDPPVV